MDGENNNPSGSGHNSNSGGVGGSSQQSPAPFRVRRPSASVISSTTPMFQAPQIPLQHQPPSTRQRHGHLHNIIHNQQNFVPGENDDEQPQSSSSINPSSLRGRLSAGLGGLLSGNSSNNNNNRPQSPLGSPDSTAYWAPSPAAHHSYRAPLTPSGGMCVVSSSTSDDIPQSPFSPEDIGGNSNHAFPQPSPAPTLRSSAHHVADLNDFNNGQQVLRRRPSIVGPSSSSTLNLSLSNSLARGGGSNGKVNSLSSQQDLNKNQNNSSSSNSSGSSSAGSSSFNILPLRNKIKKASSFERFSLAAAIISNNSGNNAAASSSSSQQNVGTAAAGVNDHSISSIPPISNTNTNSSIGTNSVSVAGSSRTIWDSSPPPPPSDPSTSAFRSFSTHGHAEKFHIKIPSKKLAAKIASVYEQEQLNEQLNATLAAAEVGSKRSGLSSSSSVIASVTGSSLSQNNHDGLNSSQQGQNPPSTLAQILNQSSNIHVNNLMTEESIMNQEVNHENLLLREFGESPLNLTDNTNANNNSSNSQQALLPPRNPVISSSRGSLSSSSSSSSSHTKKIPLTPKQKLLHRLQTGELLASALSPPPQHQQQQSQPIISLSQQIQQQQSVQIIQQQQSTVSAPGVTLHQSLSDSLQAGNHVQISNSSQHSPQQQQPIDQYSYEALLRSRDDFVMQDTLGKVGVGEDPNNVSNMLSGYDPDAYSYYAYQNILGDEIFTGNNSASSSRQLLMDQQQGPLEFVLGFSGDDGDRGRDDDLQLNNMDPNDELSSIKSQSQTDSTLRNLLMMEPTTRNSHSDDAAWLALAAAEYHQNRMNDTLSISRGGGGGNIRSNSGINVGSSSIGSLSNNINNSWANEWPRTSSWQSHPSITIGGGGGCGMGVQDDVMPMNMSMIEHAKGPSSLSNQMKRIQVQMQSSNDHGIDEIDLTTGLPMLVNMPMDLQQPMSILPHGGNNSSGKDNSLPVDLQQHHRMDIDDEPVNLMAVNIDQDQDLIHHHHGNHSNHLNQVHAHQSHQLEQNKGIQHQQNNSYALQIQSQQHSPDLQQSVSDLAISNGNNSSSSSDSVNERRIIRLKKNKDTLIMSNLNDSYQLSLEEQEHVNIIMDKPVQPKSIASLPSPFRFSRVGNEIAVFNNTTKSISVNCRLGPVEGPLRKAFGDMSNINAEYPTLVMADNENTLWQLDRSDDEFCNWMKFVRLAHSIKDQNALVVESDGYLYFMTCKEIPPNTELQVGYSYEYAQRYTLPVLLPLDFIEEDNRIMKQDNMSMSLKPRADSTPSPEPMIHEEIVEADDESGKEELEESRSITIETYSCFECDQEFNLVEDLQAHLNTHKDTEETIRKPKKKAMKKFHLSENNDRIISRKEASQTMNADSSTVLLESSLDTTSRQEIISVQHEAVGDIGKQQDNSVTTGVGQPAAPPKVKCTMCYKSFATKERLEKHMIVHSDEDTKPLKCGFCTKRFLTNSALAGHVKTHAEEGKFFECPMCNFSTPQLLQLKEHVQTHKNRETGFFYCPKCPKKFSAYSMIRKHIRAFHGPRQFTCDDCPMSFPTSDKLKLHQLKHSDHREFLCAECGKQFKRKDKLREHTKRIHETKKKSIEINIPKDKNSKKFIPKVAPEEYQRFPFKCQDCMVGFKRRGMLVNHLAKRHPEKKIKSIPELNQPILRLTRNYPCLYCERIYKSSSKRKSHIIKAHPGRPIPPQLRGTNAAAAIVEVISVPVNEVRALTTGTIVQTVTEDVIPRIGIMNVSCTNNVENNLVSTTSTSQTQKKETNVVGKVAALPHACQWCYREYATRAKLLQHQRKVHINLMPTDMQTPRTQKNNVTKGKKVKGPHSEAAATSSNKFSIKSCQKSKGTSQFAKNMEPSLIIPDSTSPTASTIQTVASVSAEGINEGNVIGYLLTTAHVTAGDLSNLVMFSPMSNLGNGGAILASQPQSLSVSSVNPNQNITIIASSSSNSKSNNV